MSKLSTQGGLWGLGCDSGHVASTVWPVFSPCTRKEPNGDFSQPVSWLARGIPAPIPACPFPPPVWVILQIDVLVFVHMVLAWVPPSGSVSLPSL